MFRLAVGNAVVVGLMVAEAALAAAPDLEFQKLTSEAGRFTVETPGKAKETVEQVGKPDQCNTFAVIAPGPKFFRVKYLTLVGGRLEEKDPRTALKLFRGGYREDTKFEGEKEITLGKDKVPGLEYTCEPKEGVFVRERLFLSGDRVYILHVVSIGDKDFLGSKDADHFFDSFKITHPDLEFQKLTSEAGRFTAEMPGEAKETINQAGTRDEEHEFAFFAGGPKIFRIEYVDLVGVNLEGKDPQTVLKLFRSGYRKDTKFEGEKEITLGKDKVPGLEYNCEPKEGVFVRERLFLAGQRIYTVHVVSVGDKDFLDSKEADRFIDSFKITK